MLTGSTPMAERMQIVNEFQNNKDIKLILMSLKAGGVGLNLTAADFVFTRSVVESCRRVPSH